MNIKSISFVESILKIKAKQRANSLSKEKSDEVLISPIALKKSKDNKNKTLDKAIKKAINDAPNIRKEKLLLLKARLASNRDAYIKNIDHNMLLKKILKSPFCYYVNKPKETTIAKGTTEQ